MDQKLMGVFAPISTPFTATGEVDYEGLKKNLSIYPKSGIKGYLALGSNGENKSLTNDEKLKVFRDHYDLQGAGSGCYGRLHFRINF